MVSEHISKQAKLIVISLLFTKRAVVRVKVLCVSRVKLANSKGVEQTSRMRERWLVKYLIGKIYENEWETHKQRPYKHNNKSILTLSFILHS